MKYQYTFATFSSGERKNSLNKTEIFYDDRGNILKIKKSIKDFFEKNIIPKELEVRRYNENNDITLEAYYKYDPKFGGKFMKDRYYIFKYEY